MKKKKSEGGALQPDNSGNAPSPATNSAQSPAVEAYLRRYREKMERALASAIEAAVAEQADDPVAFMGEHLKRLAQQDGDQTQGHHSFLASIPERAKLPWHIGAALRPETDRAGFVRFGDTAVLVSDMSGFTSTTRRLGIIHFASLIVRMRQLCLPLLHARHALFIGNEVRRMR